VSQILQKLRKDHANHLRLLMALERQVAVMERGDRPDWDIVQGIVEYCLSYSDRHHHPVEDRVLATCLKKDRQLAAQFAGLDAEHRDLAAALHHPADATHKVLQDATVSLGWFIGLIRRFLEAQREHIRREESGFYPFAERILGPAGWTDLDKSASSLVADPLFREPAEGEYLALLQGRVFQHNPPEADPLGAGV
jgi:hemerythrin-like domain-containing protein